jgi:LCP family protein required for cell wall assembly
MTNQISEPENENLPPRKTGLFANKPKWLYYTLLGLMLAVVIVIIYYVYSILNFADGIHKNPEDSIFKDVQQDDQNLPPRWEGTDRVNILILGGDSRGLGKNEVPRSDSMMIASIDPVTKKAHLFSILRDTYGVVPGHGSDRINAAIVYGGPQLAMQTVSELTGLEVQYYVYTDFQGFIKLIDAIGGIDFEVEKRMYYKDSHDDPIYHIDLRPGYQHLDGQTALAYVRFRHDALSDYTRTERQRNFLSAIADKMKTTSSIVKLPAVLSSVSPYIETNLGLEEMLKLSSLGFEVDTKSIASVQIPPSELLIEKTVRGADVLGIRDEAALKTYIQDQFVVVEETPEDEDKGDANGVTTEGKSNGTTER